MLDSQKKGPKTKRIHSKGKRKSKNINKDIDEEDTKHEKSPVSIFDAQKSSKKDDYLTQLRRKREKKEHHSNNYLLLSHRWETSKLYE